MQTDHETPERQEKARVAATVVAAVMIFGFVLMFFTINSWGRHGELRPMSYISAALMYVIAPTTLTYAKCKETLSNRR